MPKISRQQGKAIVLGVAIAYAITAVGFIAAAIGITYTNLSEGSLPVIVVITCFISVVVAGFDAARQSLSRGWMWGAAAGLLYAVVLMFVITWVQGGFVMDVRKVLLIALSLIGGGIGGMVGINFRS